MLWMPIHDILIIIQRCISLMGILVILFGVIYALYQYLRYLLAGKPADQDNTINLIRSNLGRVLLLGLECIVASDLIGTTTAPDYYSVGILASIVLIRTVLSFTINREIVDLSKEIN